MRRFFNDESFWNRPIGPSPAIDPRSEELIALMDARQGAVHVNSEVYTIPVYSADDSTPRRTVHQRPARPGLTGGLLQREQSYRQHPDFGQDVPIPDGAIPDPENDAHLAIVDWQRGLAWDMWRAHIREDGEYESSTGMVYSIDDDGVWRTEDFPIANGQSMHFHGPSRAAGVPAIGGLAMHHELVAGRIDHKLAFATNNVRQEFVYPATWTDGGQDDGPREGCVIQLDPAVDLEAFGLSPGGKVIARAMQEYGAVNVDGAKGNVVYAEGLSGQADRSWDALLTPHDLRCIPLKHYRILEMTGVVEKGDAYWHRTGSGGEFTDPV